MNWNELADRVLDGHAANFDEAITVLRSSDDEILEVLDAAFRVRRAHHGRDVRIHVLQNAKSGACPEDCSFCSQSTAFDTGVERYRMQSVDEIVAGARRADERRAVKYCLVPATRGRCRLILIPRKGPAYALTDLDPTLSDAALRKLRAA